MNIHEIILFYKKLPTLFSHSKFAYLKYCSANQQVIGPIAVAILKKQDSLPIQSNVQICFRIYNLEFKYYFNNLSSATCCGNGTGQEGGVGSGTFGRWARKLVGFNSSFSLFYLKTKY